MEKMPSPNTLKSEHLKKEYSPIIGCVHDRNNLDRETQYFLDDFKKTAEYINFNYSEEKMAEKNIENSGESTYLISSISEKNKYSLLYLDCTGVVFVGKDKKTGKNVSFLTHQNPAQFLKTSKDEGVQEKFIKDLERMMEIFKNQCALGSIDVVIFGGNEDIDLNRHINKEINEFENINPAKLNLDFLDIKPETAYIRSIKLLNYQIFEKMGFSPVVMTPMNRNFSTPNHSLDVFFDTENRRLYLLRPKQSKSEGNEAFMGSEVEEEIKKF